MPRPARNPETVALIVHRYTQDLTPMATIAADLSVSRVTVYKIIRAAGINTSKAEAAHIGTICDHCGKPIDRKRCQYRLRNRHYCNRQCYFDFVRACRGSFIAGSRQSLRLARNVVSRYYQLSKGQVVHHVDKNQRNSHVDNLAVFASARDHLRFHRGFNIAPVWSGSDLKS